MSVEKITENAERITNLVIGGTGSEDLFALAELLSSVKSNGGVPVLTVFPTDTYMEMFDDGEFEENMKRFSEVYSRHVRSALEEYAAWKVLREKARSVRQ